MIRILIFVAVVAGLAFGASWLADRPGSMVLTWQGYEARTSLLLAVGAVVAVSLAIALLWGMIGGLAALPARFRRRRAERRQSRGLAALTRGMVAVGAGQGKEAARQAGEAARLLGETPLTQLLRAQEAQLAGDGARAAALFQAMATNDQTRLLGLRGLYIEARRDGQAEAARQLAEAAFAIGANAPWTGNALLEVQAAEGDWEGALATVAGMGKAGTVDRDRARRLTAVLHTARALELEPGAPEAARDLALDAHKEAPDLVPAATAAARLLARAGDIKRAGRLLEKSWKLVQHPEIAEAYAELQPGDTVRDRLARVERLNEMVPGTAAGALALARAAIDARDWSAARKALTGIAAGRPTERACLLMAEIADGADNDNGRVREWLGRAVRAPRDPAWIADGRVLPAWAPTSPVNGRLDAVQWQVPSDPAGGRIASELMLAALPSGEDRPAAAPASLADEPIELTPTRPAAGPAGELQPPRPPDDPGPEPEDDNRERQDR